MLRAFTVRFPAEPCHRLPEKSSALTEAGRNRFIIEAGNAMTTTASTASAQIKTNGPRTREPVAAAGGLVPCWCERDVGIHQPTPRRTIHGDGFDGETIVLLERG